MAEGKEIHYIFDALTADGSIAQAQPRSVVHPKSEPQTSDYYSDATGGWVLRIPEGLGDYDETRLIEQRWFRIIADKHVALLSSQPGFTRIVFDDLVDATGFDTATASGAELGGRNGVHLLPGGTVDTVTVPLLSTPAEAVVVTEGFVFTADPTAYTVANQKDGVLANPKDGRARRWFREKGIGGFTFEVSFDNGSNFNAVTSGSLINIAPADQGNQLILRFSLAGAFNNRVGIGSWAVIYS